MPSNLQALKHDYRRDEEAVQAISGHAMELVEREDRLLKWLHYYRILRFFPPERSRQIAMEIIEYADESRTTGGLLGKDGVLAEYANVRERITPVAPLSLTGNVREVTSLTSKALWCCYPHDVPIFDAYALSALQMICRLSGKKLSAKNPSKYACFVDAWFQVYAEVEPVIEAADLEGYPYRVRVLDRLLWFLGQPSFDVALTDEVSPY